MRRGSAPFFPPSGCGRIQLEYGASHLCHTCAVYPRRTRVLDGVEETSLELSCPEATRVVLLDPQLMPLEEDGSVGATRYTPFLEEARDLEPATGDPLQYLGPVRHLVLLVLKDRSYPLWQRLFVVGMFCQRMAQVNTRDGGPGQRREPERRRDAATAPGLRRTDAAGAAARRDGRDSVQSRAADRPGDGADRTPGRDEDDAAPPAGVHRRFLPGAEASLSTGHRRRRSRPTSRRIRRTSSPCWSATRTSWRTT